MTPKRLVLSFRLRQCLLLRLHYLLYGQQFLLRNRVGNCKPIVVGELSLPGELHQVLDLSGLEELPDQQTKQQAAVEVVALVLDVEHLEAAPLVRPFESEFYPMPDQIAPSTPLLSRVREILSMLLLEHCCRVDHVDLVLTSLAMYVYHYEAPVALCLVVTR